MRNCLKTVVFHSLHHSSTGMTRKIVDSTFALKRKKQPNQNLIWMNPHRNWSNCCKPRRNLREHCCNCPLCCKTIKSTTIIVCSQMFPRAKPFGQIASKSIKKAWFHTKSGFKMELLGRFELPTSSLPRMRSTYWAIAACEDFSIFSIMATQNGLEPSTSSVTG